jgi:hypothetical protein
LVDVEVEARAVEGDNGKFGHQDYFRSSNDGRIFFRQFDASVNIGNVAISSQIGPSPAVFKASWKTSQKDPRFRNGTTGLVKTVSHACRPKMCGGFGTMTYVK